jgi:hypothetical protein
MDGVKSFEELCRKLNVMSVSLTELRYELTKLGVQFGTHPDGIITFPIDAEQQFEFCLDYKKILLEMADIANCIIPYHGFKMNCSTAVMKVIRSGVSKDLKSSIENAGYSIPQSNSFIETPQSVYDFSLKLSSTLLDVCQKNPKPENLMFRKFMANVRYFFALLVSYIFQPSPKQILLNAKTEYESLLTSTHQGLLKLEDEFDMANIPEKIYIEMKSNGKKLVQFYKSKISETTNLLEAKENKGTPHIGAKVESSSNCFSTSKSSKFTHN